MPNDVPSETDLEPQPVPISRDDLDKFCHQIQWLMNAVGPAIVPLHAMALLHKKYSGDRGYMRALIGRVPLRDDALCAILIHEQPNRILGVLVWDERLGDWRIESEDQGLLIIMKAHLTKEP